MTDSICQDPSCPCHMEHDLENVRRGAVISSEGKTRITIYVDDDVLAHYREVAAQNGRGYQTIINATLRAVMSRPQIVNVIDVKVDGNYCPPPDAWKKGRTP